MTKIIQMGNYTEQEPENIEDIHPFHMQLIEACGVGYDSFRSFLNALDDELLLEEIDEYVKNK